MSAKEEDKNDSGGLQGESDPSGTTQIEMVGPVEGVPGRNLWNVCGNKFEVDERYEIIEAMGQGAYGIVVATKDL